MVIKVGINGFGRVGRVIFRTCLKHPDIEVSAINDPAVEVEYICYLIKFDSTHGTLKCKISCTDDEIFIDDVTVKVFHSKLPNSIPWHTAGVEYVVEASGMFTSLEKASGHIESEGVKRVIVTAPSVDIPMVVIGVNHNKIKPDYKIISCGSSTLYCLAPIVKVLEDNYGLEDGFITSIHAMTPSLKPLDGLCLKGKHWRDHRSITQNIIPAVTGACKALGRVLPSVRDKMCGLAFRVPIVNVSILDLTVRLKKYTSIENIVSDVEKFANGLKETIITTSNEEAVSSDFIGNSHSCILDIGSSLQLKPNAFKLICWYENEYSYACRVVDLILFSEAQFAEIKNTCPLGAKSQGLEESKISNKTTYVRPKTSKKCDIPLQTAGDTKMPIRRENPLETQTETIVKVFHPKTNKTLDSELLGKTLIPRSIIVQESSSRDPNKRIELYKIWNTENVDKRNVRQNMSSFFQLQSQQSTNECAQAKERIEKMKKEFSKFVGITETLLDKSNQNRVKLNALKTLGHEVTIPLNIKNKSLLGRTTNKYLGINGIGKENVRLTVTEGNDEQIVDSNVHGDTKKDVIETRKDSSEDSEFKHDTIMSDIESSLTSESDKKILELKEALEKRQAENKGFISKTFTNIFDGFSKNIQNLTQTNKGMTSPSTINEEVLLEEYENKSLETCDNSDMTSRDENQMGLPTNTVKSSSEDGPSDDSYKTLHDDDDYSSSQLEGKEKQEDKPYMDMNQNENGDIAATVTNIGDAPIQQVSCTSLTESYAHAADDVSCSDCHYKNKQDIYDKLDSDSVSDTDSENFNMNGRKSQVLKISDLTNSLDDLERLDKICKIMEISDELSDRLFSALDESTNDQVSGKKWSFKDLCEKINLDEFCNKVFGK